MNRRAKDNANETVANSKLSALQMQKMKALDAKAQKEETRQRNAEQRAQEENRARNMKEMIRAQKQSAA